MAAEGQGKECWVTHSQGFNRGRGRGVNPELDKIAMFFLLRPPPFSFLPPLVSESIRTGKIVRSGVPQKMYFFCSNTKVCRLHARSAFPTVKVEENPPQISPSIPRPANSYRQYRTAAPREKFRHEDEGWGGGVTRKNRCHKFHYTARARFSLLWRLRRRKNRGDSSTSTREAASSCRNCRGLQ